MTRGTFDNVHYPIYYRRAIDEKNEFSRDVDKWFTKTTGKSVELESRLNRRHLKAIDYWLNAFTELHRFPVPWKLFQSEVKGIVLGEPLATEDAQWRPNKTMFLAVREAGYSMRHMLKSIIHELGHAFEEKMHWSDALETGKTIYGKPPFANDYCAVNAFEDFAETFMQFIVDEEYVKQVALNKYRDMKRRIDLL